MTREEILQEVTRIITQDRCDQYGKPEDSFRTVSEFWSAYLTARYGETTEVDRQDVAMMMILLKVARHTHSPKPDNWVDIAGYAACGGELAE